MKPALDLEEMETDEEMENDVDAPQLDDAPASESGDQKDPLAG
jgi:hypothetical protein